MHYICVVSLECLNHCVCRVAHEKEVKDLTNQIRDVMRKKESALKEVAELKVQLKMVEEARDNIRRDLIEANRKIREGKTTATVLLG